MVEGRARVIHLNTNLALGRVQHYAQTMHFTRTPHPSPTPDAARAQLIADPGFGTVFTDHMVVIDYDEALIGPWGAGWQTPHIGPRGPISLDPAISSSSVMSSWTEPVTGSTSMSFSSPSA